MPSCRKERLLKLFDRYISLLSVRVRSRALKGIPTRDSGKSLGTYSKQNDAGPDTVIDTWHGSNEHLKTDALDLEL